MARAFASGEGEAREFQIVSCSCRDHALHMRTNATISGSEVLLGVIAIRLAVLVVVGWSLTLLLFMCVYAGFNKAAGCFGMLNEVFGPA